MDVMALTPEKRVVDEAIKIDTKVSNIAKMLKIINSTDDRMARSLSYSAKLLGCIYGYGDIYEDGNIVKNSKTKYSAECVKKLTKYRMLGYKNIYLVNNDVVYCCLDDNINIAELRKLPNDTQIYLLDCKCDGKNNSIECGGLYCSRLKPYYRHDIHVKNYVYAIFSDGLALKCTDVKDAYFGGCHDLKVDIKESECLADIKVCNSCKIKFNNVKNTTILVNRCSRCTITLINCCNCKIKVENSSYTLVEYKDCSDLDIIDGGDNQSLGVTDEIMGN